MKRILIAEDEPRISSFLEKGLQASGYATVATDDGRGALALADSEEFDLLILDVGMPGMDGLTVLRELRSRGRRLPIVVLSARAEVEGSLSGHEGGAEEYIAKPFRFEELLERVRSRLELDRVPDETIRVGDAVLDLRLRRLAAGSQSIELTAPEFALAEIFFKHPRQVLSHQLLAHQVWGPDYPAGSGLVALGVRDLRRMLGQGSITTVPGAGYRLETVTTARTETED